MQGTVFRKLMNTEQIFWLRYIKFTFHYIAWQYGNVEFCIFFRTSMSSSVHVAMKSINVCVCAFKVLDLFYIAS